MPRFRMSSVIKALDAASRISDGVCKKMAGDEVACNVGRTITLQVLERFSDVQTIEDLRLAVKAAEVEGQSICKDYDGSTRSACASGRIAVIGAFRNHLQTNTKIELLGVPGPQLGIFISPGEKCPKGFEKTTFKAGPNKKVHACRLADGFRKHKPEDRPKGKPLRRLSKFGPGVEAGKIHPLHEYRVRKSSRKLLDD